jgi:hypothetical protein
MTLWISKGGGCDGSKNVRRRWPPALYDNPTLEDRIGIRWNAGRLTAGNKCTSVIRILAGRPNSTDHGAPRDDDPNQLGIGGPIQTSTSTQPPTYLISAGFKPTNLQSVRSMGRLSLRLRRIIRPIHFSTPPCTICICPTLPRRMPPRSASGRPRWAVRP